MLLNRSVWIAAVICFVSTPFVAAQKGNPKPTTRPGTATFRCAGINQEPPCGAPGFVVADAITGDGQPYVGVGDLTTGSGAHLRLADGEFVFDIRPGRGRTVYLNFAEQVAAPSGTFYRKTFTQATLDSFHLNTNVIHPVTREQPANGLYAIPVGQTWPSRIKSFWTDPYGVEYTIRFNPEDYPGSTNVWITREGESMWTIESGYNDVARLVSPPQGRRGALTDEGLYSMPFKVTFTVP